MKLKDVKKNIDDFFNNISAEKLYEISVLKYGFSEVTYDLENENFQTTKVSYYQHSSNNESVFNLEQKPADSNLTLAA